MRTKAPNGLTPADHYRETARGLREQAHVWKSLKARDELLALAGEYERLADFVQATKRIKTRARPKIENQN
jgi:hypothetical protein